MMPEENTPSFLSDVNTDRAGKEARLIIPPRVLVRPKKYTDVGVMEKVINQYFDDMDHQQRPYTVEGLALACGFAEVKSLLNYEKADGYDQFHSLVKMAKLKILQQRIELGLTKKSHPLMVIWTVANNFKEDYQQYPSADEEGKQKIKSFLVEMVKEEKDNGSENKNQSDGPAAGSVEVLD